MATLDVLKQAANVNTNLVLTCEPTFYGRADGQPPSATGSGTRTRPRARRSGVEAKREFIEKNGLVVFRLHDHWLGAEGNEMVAGFADALGWSQLSRQDR